MPDQIQIRWSSYSGADYEESMKALRQFDPEPSMKAALNIKGNLPKKALDDIRKIVNRYEDASLDVLLTATWGKNESPDQLRLFAPPQPEMSLTGEEPETPNEEPAGPGENEEQPSDGPSPNGVARTSGRSKVQPAAKEGDPKPDPQPDPVPAGGIC